jgi:hypothetical protein
MVLEVTGTEREALLDLSVTPLRLPSNNVNSDSLTLDALRKDRILNEEANRIAELIASRVTASGTMQTRVAPMRTAPSNLILQVANLLRVQPLTCYLCGGLMSLRPLNRLLQPSPDRIDSNLGSYESANFQLSHFACNLGKNNATVEQFKEWLSLVRAVSVPDARE